VGHGLAPSSRGHFARHPSRAASTPAFCGNAFDVNFQVDPDVNQTQLGELQDGVPCQIRSCCQVIVVGFKGATLIYTS